MKYVIVGTAGHIDHGKSALVKALTGIDPDRLEEEKRRGITIDIGFANLELGDVRIGFVDVPGHERFVKNMLAGVGGIDLVLLVIAADSSIQPQTREHFDICRLLEVRRGVIVITKMDLVERDLVDLVRLEVEEFVRGSFLEGAPIVPVSARTGEGLDRLKAELQRVAESVPGKDRSQYLRLPIDRAFVMKGFGTVVTGTLVAGTLARDEEVEIFPQQQRRRVRGLQVHNQPTERAFAGERTAVNLAGVETGELRRGMALAAPGWFEPTARVDVELTLLASARGLKNAALVHFHQGTAEMIAEVRLLDRQRLEPGGRAFAQVRLREPTLLLPGDRFIIRQFSPVITIGGGRVLDNASLRHRRGDQTLLPYLKTLAEGSPEERLRAILEREASPAVTERRLVARTGWLASVVWERVRALEGSGQVRVLSESPLLVVEAARLAERMRRSVEALEEFHQKNPLVAGMAKEELKERVFAGAPEELLRAALDELVAQGKVTLAGDILKLAGREIVLSEEEAKAKAQIEEAFARAGLKVPAVKEVLAQLKIEPKRAQKILQILVRGKTLVKVSEDLFFHRAAIEQLRNLLAEYKKKSDRLSVSAFKELTGISRKYAIPLLEYLDREKVTRRLGDERVIL